MGKTIIRALVFAGTVVAMSLVVDLLFSVFYQGGLTAENRGDFLLVRAVLHGATGVLTAVGAAVGFAFLRSYAIASSRIVLLGVVFGFVALVGAGVASQLGGVWALFAWLLCGSAIVALIGGRVYGRKEAHV